MNISHSKPDIDSKDIQSVGAILKSGQLVQGKKVAEFERKFSKFQGVKGAVALNTGTASLHLSLLALDVGKGDEVIVPSHVCTALLNAVLYTGATPRVVDVDPDDFNISVESVEKNIIKKTKAIIMPHMYGHPGKIEDLLRLKIPLIEDCAQALGAKYHGKKVGSFGILSVFSFYATKVMTCGEGGMVTSNNKRLLDKIRDLRDYDNRPTYKMRYNYKMTDMAAALGTSQLKKLPSLLMSRKKIAGQYNRALAKTDVQTPTVRAGMEHIYFRYVVKAKKSQKMIMKRLQQKGIHCAAPIYKPLHQYLRLSNCPVSEQLTKEAISVPIYPSLTEAEVQYILKKLKQVFIC